MPGMYDDLIVVVVEELCSVFGSVEVEVEVHTGLFVVRESGGCNGPAVPDYGVIRDEVVCDDFVRYGFGIVEGRSYSREYFEDLDGPCFSRSIAGSEGGAEDFFKSFFSIGRHFLKVFCVHDDQ